MKREWDLLRQQLIDIEEGNDLFAEIPDISYIWDGQGTYEEHAKQVIDERMIRARIGGHLELLVDKGYVDGITILRSTDGNITFGTHSPRLTMDGHDLLDTMRTPKVWESVKTTARKLGLELTFEILKTLASDKVRSVISGS